MKFQIVPSTKAGRQQLLTTYLIDETLAIDAGAIAVGLTTEEQLKIRSIIVTHTHLDHIISLPLYLTDLFDELRAPVNLYATPSDFDALREYIFNHRMWIPVEMLRNDHTELLAFHPIASYESFLAEGLRVTPIPVSHTILTHGLLVEGEEASLLFTSDTGPTERLWEAASACHNLRAVFIDLSFPNRLTDLARVSGHHSPLTLLEEMTKIKPGVEVYAVHIKTPYRDQVAAEIAALDHPHIRVAEIGREYHF